MTVGDYGSLCEERNKLEKLIQLYEFACADIAPPIKVLDGMPYSLTNKISSMTEDKAVRLSAIKQAIDATTNIIKSYLGDLDRIKNDCVRQMIVLRFLCGYDWKTVRDKTMTDKTTGSIRATVFYYTKTFL